MEVAGKALTFLGFTFQAYKLARSIQEPFTAEPLKIIQGQAFSEIIRV